METAILLGIPSPYVARLRTVLASRDELRQDWSLKFVPAPKKTPEINRGIVLQSGRLANENVNAHISAIAIKQAVPFQGDSPMLWLGFSTQQQRAELTAELAQSFRFRWCDELVKNLNCLATPDPAPFLQRLIIDLAEEEIWSSRVKPTDIGSPLLLPESSFGVGGNHRDMWHHARSYGDTLNIEGAAKAVRNFERVYLRKVEHYQWIDDRDLVFGREGPRHAAAPFPRGWKFAYRLPDGFHYDVKHREQHRFFITDAVGKRHPSGTKGYINVDPHGYVSH